ncbi:MAG: hypothetical protein FWC00_04640 [Firmicutes bacterium]|nr:hypothetical protein [Bacillota bacterium]
MFCCLNRILCGNCGCEHRHNHGGCGCERERGHDRDCFRPTHRVEREHFVRETHISTNWRQVPSPCGCQGGRREEGRGHGECRD